MADRISIPLLPNASFEGREGCLEVCNEEAMLQEAYEGAVAATIMSSGGEVLSLSREAVEVTNGKGIPRIEIICKGPKQKYILFGPRICRNALKMECVGFISPDSLQTD